jgi:DNA-directed RNA polymerase subunit RPC12/RpoP
MARKLNQLNLEPGSTCTHCGHEFEKPYRRMPEMEGTSGRVVLECPHCGLYSVFEEYDTGRVR